MGLLFNKYKKEVKGDDSVYYKDNTMNFYNLYQSPDNKKVRTVNIGNVVKGRFYFIKYLDKSNWMMYSPVMVCDFVDGRMIFAINFNFIPLEIRMAIFDQYTKKTEYKGFNETPYPVMTFENAYKLLIRFGYEYAIVEYEVSRVELLYEINPDMTLEFLFSGYPLNKYDPDKLYSIWLKKMETKEQRHQEMIEKIASDFYNVTDELIESAGALKGHFKRLKSNYDAFGDKFNIK